MQAQARYLEVALCQPQREEVRQDLYCSLAYGLGDDEPGFRSAIAEKKVKSGGADTNQSDLVIICDGFPVLATDAGRISRVVGGYCLESM